MLSLAYKNVEKNKKNHGDTHHDRNNVDVSTREITSKKVRGNNVDFSTIEITSKKVRGNNVDFSTSEITAIKVRGNNVDFSAIKITSKKVRRNNVDFSISEITSKKYVEMTHKFFKICSLSYRRSIDVKTMWIRRGVPLGLLLFFHYSSHHHNRYHHFHYHCKMHLDRLRILLTIPLDFNMIPCLFQQNLVFLGETKLICWSTSPTDPILSKTIKII